MANPRKYDFETLIDRSGSGSEKWEQMKRLKPDVTPGIVPFSIADMELKNPPEVVEGLKLFLDETILGYFSPTKAYLDAVAEWMEKRHDWKIDPDWIVTSAGVVPGFYAALRYLARPGEGVIVQTPVYYPFFGAIRDGGLTIVRNPLKLEDGAYSIDFDDLEEKASDAKNKILLFCSPHNPVGRVWTRDELKKVGEICLRHKVLIISDEIHFDLIMPGYAHTVFASISEELAENMVVCTAPSKTFNLAGLQTSNFIIPHKRLRETFAEKQRAEGVSGVNIIGAKACEIAYKQCGAWLDRLIELVRLNHETVKAFFAEKLPGVRVFDLEGTYLQWLDFRGFGMDKIELEKFMRNEAELFLDEGYIFGEEGAGFERLNLGCPTSTLVAALERLAAARLRQRDTNAF